MQDKFKWDQKQKATEIRKACNKNAKSNATHVTHAKNELEKQEQLQK